LPVPVAAPVILDDTNAAFGKKSLVFVPNPKKSGLYSALVPGTGQLYNRQYWKLPIVYVGAGVAAYFISSTLTSYQAYRKAYITSLANPNYLYEGVYNQTTILQLETDAEKNLDMAVLFTGLGYALQVLDAVAFAHLHNFDMSRDLSLHIKSANFPNGAGIGLALVFR
jgi:hypothetical protein